MVRNYDSEEVILLHFCSLGTNNNNTIIKVLLSFPTMKGLLHSRQIAGLLWEPWEYTTNPINKEGKNDRNTTELTFFGEKISAIFFFSLSVCPPLHKRKKNLAEFSPPLYMIATIPPPNNTLLWCYITKDCGGSKTVARLLNQMLMLLPLETDAVVVWTMKWLGVK